MTVKQAVEAADSRVDWRREYKETLTAVQAGDGGRSADSGSGSGSNAVNRGEAEGKPLVAAAPVEHFLDRVLLAASEKPGGEQALSTAEKADATAASEALTLRKRLAAIGRTLRPLLNQQEPTLTGAVKAKAQPQSTENKSARIGLLQLELVVRAIAYGGVKGKSAKKAARSEIRGLLDRIALLLDAANPASIAGDDGRSPFQELLEGVLAPRLEKPLPRLVRYLLKAYELLDEERDDGQGNDALPRLNALATSSMATTASRSSLEGDGSSLTVAASSSTDASKQSILSALMEERPKKRSRDELGDKFKEMLLPQELQQLQRKQHKHRHNDKTRRESTSTSSSTSKRHKSADSRSSKSVGKDSSTSAGTTNAPTAVTASSSASVPSVRRTISLDAALRSAGTRTLPSRRSLPSTSSFASPAVVSAIAQSRHSQSSLAAAPRLGSPPLLQAQARRTVSSLGQLPRSSMLTQPQTSWTVPTSASTAAVAAHRQVNASRRALVMRTPDRPRRQPARTLASSASSSTGRVLVAASPPLRRPPAGAQQQLRQQNAQPLLGASSARRQHPRAPPPPLFR